MASANAAMKKVRAICLALPGTAETPTWGQPHFRVADKIFAGCGEEGGHLTLSFKLERVHAAALVRDGRFTPAAYVGRHGWVSMDATQISDWQEIAELIGESYRLIAPKARKAKAKPKPKKTSKSKSRRPRELRKST